jgi:TetR/AcrR family transcriptional repressor of nem operon
VKISREQVEINREHLVRVAMDQFRQYGFAGIGLADLTARAGMSLGSFYRYFASKEQLVAECSARIVIETKDRLTSALTQPSQDAFIEAVANYLSLQHRNSVGKGCGLAALGCDIAHETSQVRAAATAELQQLFTAIGSAMPGKTAGRRRGKAISMMASLMGGLILSRIANDAELSSEILNAVSGSVKETVGRGDFQNG